VVVSLPVVPSPAMPAVDTPVARQDPTLPEADLPAASCLLL
jgi:hypothetical protein